MCSLDRLRCHHAFWGVNVVYRQVGREGAAFSREICKVVRISAGANQPPTIDSNRFGVLVGASQNTIETLSKTRLNSDTTPRASAASLPDLSTSS